MQLLQTSASRGGAHSGDSSTNLSRSVSSVGEHSTGASTPPLPKRADTFSGFESKENHRGQSVAQSVSCQPSQLAQSGIACHRV